MKEKNHFKIRGYISFIEKKRKSIFVLVRSHYKYNTGVLNTVVLSGGAMQIFQKENITVNDFVEIDCKIKSFRRIMRQDDNSEKRVYWQILIGINLKKINRDLTNRYPAAVHNGVITGSVTDIYAFNDHDLRLTIRLDTDGRYSFITCFQTVSNTEMIINKLKTDDHVEVHLNTESKKKIINGVEHTFNDCIAYQIEKI